MVQRKVATASVGPSTVRGQGAPGLVAAAHRHLSSVDLRDLAVTRASTFRDRLDSETESLRSAFPKGGRSWGAARKCVNLFLRDCLYNAYLREARGLGRVEPLLEIPLDSLVARELRRLDAGKVLPRWPGLKHLQPCDSDQYQAFAAAAAQQMGVARVHLDAYLWLQARGRRSN
jgi:hypothetical protein